MKKTIFPIVLLIACYAFLFNFRENQNSKVMEEETTVKISTELGSFDIELFTEEAPVTTGNFLRYVDAGRYDSVATFYRVVNDHNQSSNSVKIHVIQGGLGFTKEGETLNDSLRFESIEHESTRETGLQHVVGTISMARLGAGTADAEFFICLQDESELDWGGNRNSDRQGFAAFGQVINGMEVIQSIYGIPLIHTEQFLPRPIKIYSIERL